jgi:hypothetical protein
MAALASQCLFEILAKLAGKRASSLSPIPELP